MKKIGFINLGFISLLILIYGLLLPTGLIRVTAWILLKLILPIGGFVMFGVNLFLLFIYRKRGNSSHYFSGLIISLLYIIPFLVTANVIPIAFPTSINKVSPTITVQWPLTEKSVIGWGGNSIENNLPHAMWGSERWAYDIVMSPNNTNQSDPTTYGIWDQEIISPVDGKIIAVKDDEEDIDANSEDFTSTEGNYVYIKVKETGTFLLLNHLKQDSLEVTLGDKVEAGDLLGRVGNSGSTSEPHLHIHHQRQNPNIVKHFLLAEGLPLYFEINGQSQMPLKSTVVMPQ